MLPPLGRNGTYTWLLALTSTWSEYSLEFLQRCIAEPADVSLHVAGHPNSVEFAGEVAVVRPHDETLFCRRQLVVAEILVHADAWDHCEPYLMACTHT